MTFWFIYFISGLGVALVFSDELPNGLLGAFLFLVLIAFWPMIFMFTLTTTVKALASPTHHKLMFTVKGSGGFGSANQKLNDEQSQAGSSA